MRALNEQLASYAGYHRDRRNIGVHFVGIPMITVAVAVLLSRPSWMVGGIPVSLALLLALGATVFYLRLDWRYGLTMGVLMALNVWIGAQLASGSTALWLGSGLGLFVVGWVFQLVGHVWEGRKPAFLDDLVGLLVGPLFIAAELGFALGLRSEVRDAIERQVGPTHIRTDAPATQTPR
ncbi:MAG TPA: Mpo1-like protein [Myxococcaceae bacterium]|nr:Mpo1-like protein [Myxococcaceae bacterium]